MHDIPSSATLLDYGHGSDPVYLRFHGPDGKYRRSCDDAILSEYASYIKEWRVNGKNIEVYFNNTMGDAVRDLDTLDAFVEQK